MNFKTLLVCIFVAFFVSTALAYDSGSIIIKDVTGTETNEIDYENQPVDSQCCIRNIAGVFYWYSDLYVADEHVRVVSDGSWRNDTGVDGNGDPIIWEHACSPATIDNLAPASYTFICGIMMEGEGSPTVVAEEDFSIIGEPWYNLELKIVNEQGVEKIKFPRGERIQAKLSFEKLSKKGRFYVVLLDVNGNEVEKTYGQVYNIPPAVVWEGPFDVIIDIGTPSIDNYEAKIGFDVEGQEEYIEDILKPVEVTRPVPMSDVVIEVCSSDGSLCIDKKSQHKMLLNKDFSVNFITKNIKVDHNLCFTVKYQDTTLINECTPWRYLDDHEEWLSPDVKISFPKEGLGPYSAEVVVEHEFGKRTEAFEWEVVNELPETPTTLNVVPLISPLLLKN